MLNGETIERLTRSARESGLVVLAGAGVSMDAPSSLPSWWDLNTMILEAVAGRVREYFEDRQEIEDLLQVVIERRDVGQVFPPDYQAQLMEEQCGETYFRVLQALDVDQRNTTHDTIAALAGHGYVSALVTTNFDRLLEQALVAHGVAHRAYRTTEEYRALADTLRDGQPAELPVIKIHGCVSDVHSMVDTLKQRLRGRGPALNSALEALLHRHYWLYCGFSGADLDYDPEYLGLRAAAKASPGFTFLHLADSPPRESVRSLETAYGEKARFAAGTLCSLFDLLLHALEVPLAPPPLSGGNSPALVLERVQAWAGALHPMEAINVLAALVEAAGEESAALWVLHRTWKWYRRPDDTSGEAYSRYLFNYGRLALAHGEIGYEETPQNFFRSREHVPEAQIYEALFWLYAGRTDYCVGTLDAAYKRGFDELSPAFVIDRALVFGRFAELYGEFELALDTLPYAYERAQADGDEPRRGRVLALRALLEARTGSVAAAMEAQDLVSPIARRLGDEVLQGEADFARAVAHYVANELEQAWEALDRAAEVFSRQERIPLLVAVYLEWVKVSYEMGRMDDTKEFYQRAYEHIEQLPVYEPHLYWLRGRVETISGDYDRAIEAIMLGREAAEVLKNQWMVERLDLAAAELERAAGGLPSGGI